MKIEVFESHLNTINPLLFSFSFALIPDYLQAQQVVLDSIYVMTLDEELGLIEEIKSIDSFEDSPGTVNRIRIFLFKNIYSLCKRRSIQLKGSLDYGPGFAPYYNLCFEEKALLYLKYKTDFELDKICQIMEIDRTKLLVVLNSARNNVASNAGIRNSLESCDQ